MKNKKKLLILVLVFAVVLVGAYVLYTQLGQGLETEQLSVQQSQTPTDPGKEITYTKAPDFTVYDAQGKEAHLSDYFGKPIVLNFWASWCGPCKMEMPNFEEAYLQYGEEIQFMMVSLTDNASETVETAKAFIHEQGYTFPVYFDTEASGAIAYGVTSIPMTYFIDADGNGVAYAMGTLDAKSLQQGIDMLLSK